MIRFVRICLFFLLLAATKKAFSGPVDVYSITSNIYLGPYVEILEDPEKEMTLSDAQEALSSGLFIRSEQKIPYYQFTDSAYWVHFTLTTSTILTETPIMLSLEYPLMDKIFLYEIEHNYIVRSAVTGYNYPFNNRATFHHNFNFPLTVTPDHPKEIFLRFENSDRMEIPLKLWELQHFNKHDQFEQLIMGGYISLILMALFVNILFWILIRKRIFLLHIFFIISFAVFQLTQHGYIVEFFPFIISSGMQHYIPFSIALLLLSIILFVHTFLDIKKSNKTFYYIDFILSAVILSSFIAHFFVPYSLSIFIQLTLALINIVWVLFLLFFFSLKGHRQTLYLLAALAGLLLGGILYALKVAGVVRSNFFINYAMQIGSLFHFVLLTIGLARNYNVINALKTRAENQVQLSRERFKTLIDTSDQIIFLFDNKFNILSVNNQVSLYFKTRPEEMVGKSFLEYIYDRDEKEPYNRRNVQEKIAYFLLNKNPIRFETIFKTKGFLEPKNMSIQLELIKFDNNIEILARVATVIDDSLVKHFCTESQSYVIPNLLFTANDITQRMTRNLSRYISEAEVQVISMGLRELVINAIEHGNLDVSFEDKSKAKEENSYFELLEKRRNAPRYDSRKVHISFCIEAKQAAFTISDEGEGFDHSRYIGPENIETYSETHGRGIRMVRNIFDTVLYNKKGNSVTVTKRFKEPISENDEELRTFFYQERSGNKAL